MARGISDLQLKILGIVNAMPDGGGYLTEVNKKIKAEIFPEVWKKETYTFRKGGRDKGYGKIIKGEWIADNAGFCRRQNQLLKVRVTISKSIKGLERRGYLSKRAHGRAYKFSFISITEEGRSRLMNSSLTNNF